MGNYALFLYQDRESYEDLSAAQIGKLISDMVAWRKSLDSKGSVKSSFKLAENPGHTVVHHGDEAQVLDGPYADIKEVLGGVFVISADSYDEAVDTARTCPFTQLVGRIEVREIEEGVA